MTVQEAKLVARGRHRTIMCPSCGRTLGEVHDDQVTIKAGERFIKFPMDAPVTQVCPKCGAESTAHQAAA